MSQPPNYTPETDFSEQEANNVAGRSTVKTALLDAEFANISASISATLSNLARIQRDDGEIADLMVKVPTLSQDVLNLIGGFRVRGLWEDFTEYQINDIATYGEYLYLCVQAHTSGATFSPSYWIQFGFSGASDAVQAAAQAQQIAISAAASELSASTSAANALTAATNSANSAASASTSAYGALNSSNMAQQSATNSANSAAIAQAAAANLPNATAAGANKAVVSNSTATGFDYLNGTQLSALFGLALTANSVQKTGDTMTGSLTFTSQSAVIVNPGGTGNVIQLYGDTNAGGLLNNTGGWAIRIPKGTSDAYVFGDAFSQGVRLARITELLGVGQTWQNVTSSRVTGTTYYNTTGKPIQLSIERTSGGANANSHTLTIGGVVVSSISVTNTQVYTNLNHIVPPGASYLLTLTGSASVLRWTELR